MATALLIANFLLVLVTASLVYITGKYVSHTKKMADVLAKDYELRVTPFIDISRSSAVRGGKTYQVTVGLKNIGQNKAFLKNVKVSTILENRETEPIDRMLNQGLIELSPESGPSSYTVDIPPIPPTTTPYTVYFSYDYTGIDQKFRHNRFIIYSSEKPR